MISSGHFVEFFEGTFMENTSTFSSNTTSGSSANPVQRGVDSAGSLLHSGIDKVSDPARNAVDSFSAAAHDSVNRLASNVQNTASRFSEQTRLITEAPGKALAYSKSRVQEQPLVAVGAALAVGYILGRLSSR